MLERTFCQLCKYINGREYFWSRLCDTWQKIVCGSKIFKRCHFGMFLIRALQLCCSMMNPFEVLVVLISAKRTGWYSRD